MEVSMFGFDEDELASVADLKDKSQNLYEKLVNAKKWSSQRVWFTQL